MYVVYNIYNIYRDDGQTYLFMIDSCKRDLSDRQIRVHISAQVVCLCVVPKRSEGLNLNRWFALSVYYI